MNLDEMKALYKKANKLYNAGGKTLMTDREFDALEKKIKKLDPTWSELRKTGAPVANKKVEVSLMEPMPSLAKCYPETIGKWIAKQAVKLMLVMHKLDGSALQGRYSKGQCVFLATRGDGKIGKNISFLIPHLKLPRIKDKGDLVLRFEAVISNAKFKKWERKSEDDKDKFDNPRNMVNGLLNRRESHAAMKDIDIVVLGVYGKPMATGLEWAVRQGFAVVRNSIQRTKSDYEQLLIGSRQSSEYDIDGLVLAPPEKVFSYDSYDRPKWTTAYKSNEDEAVETQVEEVIWQHSRNSRLTPKIQIKPVKLKGAVITYCTVHNAEWMTERGIGVGAVVWICRSGDVIPKVVGVKKKAKKVAVPDCNYVKQGVHFVAVERHKDADVREIHHFFSTLGIEHIARKTIDKLYDAGFIYVLDHLKVYGNDKPFRRAEEGKGLKSYTISTCGVAQLVEGGLGWAVAAKVHQDMRRVLEDEGVTLLQLMNASNCFESFGERKLQMIQNAFMALGQADPLKDYVKMSNEQLAMRRYQQSVTRIKGMGEASTQQFFEGLQRFKDWFKPILATKLIKINPPEKPKKKKKVVGNLTGQFVSFTSYRDSSHEAAVELMGAEIVKYGAKTTILLYKKGGKLSGKIEAAQSKGIRVCTFEELE